MKPLQASEIDERDALQFLGVVLGACATIAAGFCFAVYCFYKYVTA